MMVGAVSITAQNFNGYIVLKSQEVDERYIFNGSFDGFPKRDFDEVYSHFNETLKWTCPEEVLVYKFNIKIGFRSDTLNELYMPELGLTANLHEYSLHVFAHNGKRYLRTEQRAAVLLYETKVYTKAEFQEVFTLLCRYLEAERIKKEVSMLVDSIKPLLDYEITYNYV